MFVRICGKKCMYLYMYVREIYSLNDCKNLVKKHETHIKD